MSQRNRSGQVRVKLTVESAEPAWKQVFELAVLERARNACDRVKADG